MPEKNLQRIHSDMFIFIVGASRSGKSYYAEKRLEEFSGSPKIYIAASKIYDDEMRARVELHKERRKNKGFVTIERTCGLAGINFPASSSVLIESLTVWVANEMFRENEIKKSEYVCAKILDEFISIKARCRNVIIVSDDVFSDCVIYDAMTEQYIRTLAELTCRIAELADEVIECVGGLLIHYKKGRNNL